MDTRIPLAVKSCVILRASTAIHTILAVSNCKLSTLLIPKKLSNTTPSYRGIVKMILISYSLLLSIISQWVILCNANGTTHMALSYVKLVSLMQYKHYDKHFFLVLLYSISLKYFSMVLLYSISLKYLKYFLCFTNALKKEVLQLSNNWRTENYDVTSLHNYYLFVYFSLQLMSDIRQHRGRG